MANDLVMVDGVRVFTNSRATSVVMDIIRFCIGQMDARPTNLTIHFSMRRAYRVFGTFLWRKYRPSEGNINIYTRYQPTPMIVQTIAHELAHAEDYALGTLAERYRVARSHDEKRRANTEAERYADARSAVWLEAARAAGII